MLFRLLLLGTLVWLGMRLWRWWNGPAPRPPARRVREGRMVRCHRCGVYLPEGDALQADGHFYCCREHSP